MLDPLDPPMLPLLVPLEPGVMDPTVLPLLDAPPLGGGGPGVGLLDPLELGLPEPPELGAAFGSSRAVAKEESCAKPMEGGSARKTE